MINRCAIVLCLKLLSIVSTISMEIIKMAGLENLVDRLVDEVDTLTPAGEAFLRFYADQMIGFEDLKLEDFKKEVPEWQKRAEDQWEARIKDDLHYLKKRGLIYLDENVYERALVAELDKQKQALLKQQEPPTLDVLRNEMYDKLLIAQNTYEQESSGLSD